MVKIKQESLANTKESARQRCEYKAMKAPSEEICGKSTQGI